MTRGALILVHCPDCGAGWERGLRVHEASCPTDRLADDVPLDEFLQATGGQDLWPPRPQAAEPEAE